MFYSEKIIQRMNNELQPCPVCRWSDAYDAMCKNCQKHINESNTICFSSWDPKYRKEVTMHDILETFTDEQKDFIYLIIGLCGDECEPGNAYKDTLDNIPKFLKTLTIEQKRFLYLILVGYLDELDLI